MPSPLRHLPNLISAARVLLVLPIVWALIARRFELAVWLFVVAGTSDALDGYLAKQFGWTSRLGGILDALADKFLLVSTFVCLWWLAVFPWWLVAWVLFRDLLIVVGGVVYNYRVETFSAEPSRISKINTFLQILLVAIGVIDLGVYPLPEVLILGLVWAVMLTVLLSGGGYVIEWSRRAAKHSHRELQR